MLLDSNIVIYAAEPKYDSVRYFIEQQNLVVSVISKIGSYLVLTDFVDTLIRY